MRILQVSSYYAPAWAYGGPPRVMFDLARGLVDRGHEVTALTTDVLDGDHRATPRFEKMEGVTVERFPNLSNALAWRSKKYLPPGLVVALARRMRSYDVVHATDTRTVATAAAYLAARRAGVPFCLSAHGSLPGSTGLRGSVKQAYDRVLVRPMLASAALLLAQTAHEEALYRTAGASLGAVRRLPLPVDLEACPASRDRGFLREKIGVDDSVPLVLFLGRIHELKGVDVLVRSLEPMLTAGDVRLVVAGRDDGAWAVIAEEHQALLARGSLFYFGPVYGVDRFRAYADADLFCLTPRHWEETSLASLEAAAMGTPVVVSEQAEIPGLVESGGGAVVPLDAAAIRAAVTDVLARPDAGLHARRLIHDQHDRLRVVEQLEQYLLDVTST